MPPPLIKIEKLMTTRKKSSSAKKKSSRKKTSVLNNQKFRVLLASVFLAVFVGVCLLLLVFLRKSYLPETPRVVQEPPPAEVHQVYNYEQVYALVETELLTGPLSQGWQKLPTEGSLQRLKMFGDYPDHGRMVALAEKIALTGAPAYLDLLPRKGLVQLYWQDQLRLELRYRVPLEISSSRPRIAIIMDDMGGSMKTFQELLGLGLDVTPSILPETHNATEGALLMQKAGREYMIHIPMQPKDYPRLSPGPNALLLGESEMRIRQLVRHYMEKVPGAAGGNNHMGSAFTLQREPMHVVLDELKHNGQFFIDSKTIAGSVGYDEARKMGLPTAARNIFLDNEENVDYIRQQLRKMLRLSEDKGEVVAICHPYPQTLEALRLEQPWLLQQQVDFVPASALAHSYQ